MAIGIQTMAFQNRLTSSKMNWTLRTSDGESALLILFFTMIGSGLFIFASF